MNLIKGSSIDGPSENDNQTYRLRGTSQPEKCLKLLKEMISTNCTNNKTCGLNDVLQPEVHVKFMVSLTRVFNPFFFAFLNFILISIFLFSGFIIILLFNSLYGFAIQWTKRRILGENKDTL